jgi:PiT family inorganic phosphate transporter
MLVVGGIIALALAFDFVNGFHDAANSIATVVSTRVLRPSQAVVWAAAFNFIAFLFFGLHVATTIGKGVVDPSMVTVPVIAAGLFGAIVWDLLTWHWGIPTSSSHALVGGFAGAAVAHAGPGALKAPGLIKIGAFIVIAPVLGMAMGFVFMVATYWIFRRATPQGVSGLFRKLQLLSSAAYSLGHGGNDAQKTMGIILAVLIAGGYLGKDAGVPLWVVLSCHAAMGLGTLAGGWRIVKTMGQKICHLQPVHGFSAESAGALCLYGATWLGIPVSTTHTITGSIIGVGATRGIRAVKWQVAGRIVWAWILTIPAAAGVAALTWGVFSLLGWR